MVKGFKGKGVLIHCLVDAQGLLLQAVVTAANASEHAQVMSMLESLRCSTGSVGTGRFRPTQIAADKGYNAKWLRETLRGLESGLKFPTRVFSTRRQTPVESSRSTSNATLSKEPSLGFSASILTPKEVAPHEALT